MRADIDEILINQGVDALWVMGAMKHNADMVYFTGPQDVKNADLFKVINNPPKVFHATAMEREEAEKSGLETHAYDTSMPLEPYLAQNHGNLSAALAARTRDVFNGMGLHKGRVAISGQAPLDAAFSILNDLKRQLPGIEFISYIKDSAIQKARMTKEPDEIERIQKMGQITTKVVGKTADFLTTRHVENNHLIDENNQPITIAEIKRLINLWLAEEGVENPEETIFSIGRDAGVSHNTGNPGDMIELGKSIVFDIYPCEKGGGYFYDFTRTWCLGYAPADVQELYEHVESVYGQVINKLEAGKPFKYFQEITCQLFYEMGHDTIAKNPKITEGYVHSIGHGLGLDVHENPLSGVSATESDILLSGVVFTVEPGLYYPSKGMGVRIEDTVYLNQQGQFEILAEYPHDLVLPMKRK